MFFPTTTTTILTPNQSKFTLLLSCTHTKKILFMIVKQLHLFFSSLHFFSMHLLQLWIQLTAVENKGHDNVYGEKVFGKRKRLEMFTATEFNLKLHIWSVINLWGVCDSSLTLNFREKCHFLPPFTGPVRSFPCGLVTSWPPQHRLLLNEAAQSLVKVKQKNKEVLKTTGLYQGNYRSHSDHNPSLSQWNHRLKQWIIMGSWIFIKTKWNKTEY